MNWGIFDALFGQAFGNVIGNPVLVGIIILLFFAGLIINVGVSFDAVIAIMIPVVWVISTPPELGGASFLPVWFFGIEVILMAAMTYFAFTRFVHR